jgi:hypothetical protein
MSDATVDGDDRQTYDSIIDTPPSMPPSSSVSKHASGSNASTASASGTYIDAEAALEGSDSQSGVAISGRLYIKASHAPDGDGCSSEHDSICDSNNNNNNDIIRDEHTILSDQPLETTPLMNSHRNRRMSLSTAHMGFRFHVSLPTSFSFLDPFRSITSRANTANASHSSHKARTLHYLMLSAAGLDSFINTSLLLAPGVSGDAFNSEPCFPPHTSNSSVPIGSSSFNAFLSETPTKLDSSLMWVVIGSYLRLAVLFFFSLGWKWFVGTMTPVWTSMVIT